MRDVAYWPKTFLDEVEQSKVERGFHSGLWEGLVFSIAPPRQQFGLIHISTVHRTIRCQMLIELRQFRSNQMRCG